MSTIMPLQEVMDYIDFKIERGKRLRDKHPAGSVNWDARDRNILRFVSIKEYLRRFQKLAKRLGAEV